MSRRDPQETHTGGYKGATLGMGAGVAPGVGIGVALDNLALRIGSGIAPSVRIGASLDLGTPKRNGAKDAAEDDPDHP